MLQYIIVYLYNLNTEHFKVNFFPNSHTKCNDMYDYFDIYMNYGEEKNTIFAHPEYAVQNQLTIKTNTFSESLYFVLFNYLKALMPITFSSPRAQPEVVYFLISNESPYFSDCKSKISASNSL